jgi:hypothetical protein
MSTVLSLSSLKVPRSITPDAFGVISEALGVKDFFESFAVGDELRRVGQKD